MNKSKKKPKKNIQKFKKNGGTNRRKNKVRNCVSTQTRNCGRHPERNTRKNAR